MIKNVSKKNRNIEKEINDLVGKSYSIWARIKMNGNGSPRLTISDASESIKNLLARDNNLNYCNIEIRPNGILLGFKSRLEVFAWCIPYYRLRIFQNQKSVTLYSETEKVILQNKSATTNSFFRKLNNCKLSYLKKEELVQPQMW